MQALNTGHGGSLTTVHANNAESALSRLASCAMQGGGDLPWEVTCRGVVDGISMVIHMTRADGRRFVEEAAVCQGLRRRNESMEHRTTPASESLRLGRARILILRSCAPPFAPGKRGGAPGSLSYTGSPQGFTNRKAAGCPQAMFSDGLERRQ